MNVMTEQEVIVGDVIDDVINGIEDETIPILADWCEDNGQYDLAMFLRTPEPFRITEITERTDDIGGEPVTLVETDYEDRNASWCDVYRRYRRCRFESIGGWCAKLHLGEWENPLTGDYEVSYVIVEAKDQRPLPRLVVDILERLFE